MIVLALVPAVVAVIVQVALRAAARASEHDWIDDARPISSCLMISNGPASRRAPGLVGSVVWVGRG